MLAQFRAMVRPFFAALAWPLNALGLSPNHVTLLSIPLAAVAAYFFWNSEWVSGLLFLFLSTLCDALDGALAGLQQKKTVVGNYLDAVVDRITESFFFLGFVNLFPLASFLAVTGSTLVSYSKARAGLVVISDNRDWPGFGERSERLILLVLGVVVSIFVSRVQGFAAMELFLYAIALLAWLSGLNRLRFGLNLVREAEKKGELLPYLKTKQKK